MKTGTYTKIYEIAAMVFNSSTPSNGIDNACKKYQINPDKARRIYNIGFELFSRNTERGLKSGKLKLTINS